MPKSPTAGRLLRLLAMLQARRDWTGAELGARLQVSPRTIRRDVERLRELGYPIESRRGPGGSYALRAGTAMPPLLLEDEEAVAVAIALSTAARAAVAGIEETALRALVKLEQVLPGALRRRVQALGEATEAPSPRDGGEVVDARTLTLLAGARRDGEIVRFAYTGRDGRPSRRTVEPHALVTLGRRWYLLAFDPERGGWRTFRVDRIAAPVPGARRFRARPIPGGDAAAYVTRRIAATVYTHRARVRFHANAGRLRDRLPRGWGELRELADGTWLYDTSDDDLEWLAHRIVLARADFDVEGSPELLDRLETIAARLTRAVSAARSGTAQAGSGSTRSSSA